MQQGGEWGVGGGRGNTFLVFFWLDLEKFCFLDNLVALYKDHLSVARKLGMRDAWLGRTKGHFLQCSVEVGALSD